MKSAVRLPIHLLLYTVLCEAKHFSGRMEM